MIGPLHYAVPLIDIEAVHSYLCAEDRKANGINAQPWKHLYCKV